MESHFAADMDWEPPSYDKRLDNLTLPPSAGLCDLLNHAASIQPFSYTLQASSSSLEKTKNEFTEAIFERLERFPNDAKFVDKYHGWTPLMKAVNNRMPLSIVRRIWLAWPAAVVTTNKRKKLPLFYAIEADRGNNWNGYDDVYQFLFDRSRVFSAGVLASVIRPLPELLIQNLILPFVGDPLLGQDSDGNWSLLHSIVMRNASVDKISQFIQHVPKALTLKSVFQSTPLHEACRSGSANAYEVIRLILLSCPESASLRTKDGNTPMHLACKYGLQPSIIKLLYNAYPPAVYTQNECGFTCLHCLCWNERPCLESIRFLVQVCPESRIYTTGPGNRGYLPMQIVMGSANSNLIRLLAVDDIIA